MQKWAKLAFFGHFLEFGAYRVDLKLNILILLNDLDQLVMVSPMCCIVNDLLTDVEHAGPLRYSVG